MRVAGSGGRSGEWERSGEQYGRGEGEGEGLGSWRTAGVGMWEQAEREGSVSKS